MSGLVEISSIFDIIDRLQNLLTNSVENNNPRVLLSLQGLYQKLCSGIAVLHQNLHNAYSI